MKYTLTILGFILTSSVVFATGITNYKFNFKVTGLKNTEVYLGFHMGDKKYVRDTAKVNEKGEFSFAGKDTLEGGIYLVVLPSKKYFEFVVSGTENTFTITADTVDFYKNMKVSGSVENSLWVAYLQYAAAQQAEADKIKKEMDGLDKESPRYQALTRDMDKIGESVINYRLDVIKKHPSTLVARIMMAMRDVEVPEAPQNMDTAEAKVFRYWYYRNHYWDGFDLSDNRIIRTPLFEGKLKNYFEKVLPQQPDTVTREADRIIKLTENNDDMFRYVVYNLTYSFERSQVMCMDKAFVHMVDTYYKTGRFPWVDEKTKTKMIERADKLRPLRCGEVIPNIVLPDTGGVWHNLHRLPNEYVVVYFYDAACGHCKKATPELQKLYESYLKPQGIEIYAVEGTLEDDEWKKFIREHKLTFINVSDNPEINSNAYEYISKGYTTLESLNFRLTFDLSSYPVVYFIDKDRKIIGKKLSVEQLQDFIENYKQSLKKSN